MKYQNSASLAFVWGIDRWPVNCPHKGPVTRKMFPFNDVIMEIMCMHNENIDIHNWIMAIHNWNNDIHDWNINFHNWILDVHNWMMDTQNWIIRSAEIPGVTLCFCTSSYAPLPPAPPLQTTDICSRDKFWTIFRIPFILGSINDHHL